MTLTNKKTLFVLSLACLLFFNQSFSINAAFTKEEETSPQKETLELIEDAEPYDIVTEDITKTGNSYTSKIDDQTVIIKKNQTISFTSNDGTSTENIEIDLSLDNKKAKTSVIDNTIIMSNPKASYETTTEIFDGGMRNCFIIEEDCEKEEFVIDFSLPEGSRIEYSKDEYNNNAMDGSLLILDKSDKIIGAIGIPWAKDANGNTVETYYQIEDSTIIQHVKHKNVENINYPIVADPLFTLGSFFDSVKWITRNGVVSLSINPNTLLRMAILTASSSMKELSWQGLYEYFHTSSKWKNTESMKKQYYCHWYFALLKENFNLEPSRENVSWVKMVTKACNP